MIRDGWKISLLVIALLAAAPLAAEHQAKEQKETVFIVDNSGFPPPSPMLIPAPGDWGRLIRQADRIEVQARLSGLNPELVYNFHIFVFNNPDACSVTPPFDALGSRCTPLVDQGPMTESSVISFGGYVPDSTGVLEISVTLKVSEGLPVVGFFGTNGSFVNVVNGPGLTNPMGAELQFDLARKGPIQKDMTAEQFQTMFGACGPTFTLPPLDPNQLCEVVRECRVGGTLSRRPTRPGSPRR
jgi:hypothetical protein